MNRGLPSPFFHNFSEPVVCVTGPRGRTTWETNLIGSFLQRVAGVMACSRKRTGRARAVHVGLATLMLLASAAAASANVAPSEIQLHGSSVREHAPGDTIVGILKVVDDDESDTHTLALVPGDRADDNALFAVLGDTLRTVDEFDYETCNGFAIRIRAEDSAGAGIEQETAFHVFVVYPGFVSRLNDYWDANAAVKQASIDRLEGESLDYFWVYPFPS